MTQFIALDLAQALRDVGAAVASSRKWTADYLVTIVNGIAGIPHLQERAEAALQEASAQVDCGTVRREGIKPATPPARRTTIEPEEDRRRMTGGERKILTALT